MSRRLAFTFLLAGLMVVPATRAQTPEIASLRTKAEKGNSIAQYNLGLTYLAGREVDADWPEAYVWLTLAAENGTTGKALQTVVEQMSATQLADGRRRLAATRETLGQPAEQPAVAETGDAQKELSAELAKLRSEATTLGAQNQTLEDAAALRGRTLDEVRARLENAEGRVAALTSEQAQWQQQLDAARAGSTQLNETQTALTAARTELAAAKVELTESRDSSAALSARLAEANTKLTASGREIITLRNELAATRDAATNQTAGEVTSLQNEIQRLRAEVASLGESNQRLEDTAAARGRELEAARTRLAAASENLTQVTNTEQSLQAEIDRLKAAALQAADRTTALNELRETLRATRAEADIAQAQLAQQQSLIDQQQSRLNSLRSELDQSHSALAAAAPDSEAAAKLAALTKDNAALKQQLESAQNEAARQVETVSVELGTSRAQIARLQSENQSLTARLAATPTADPADAAALNETRDALAAAEADLARAQAARSDAEARTEALAGEMESLQSRLAEATTQLAAAKSTAATPAVDASALADLQAKLETALRSYTLLQDENDSLKVAAAQLETKVGRLEGEPAEATAADAELQDKLDTALASYRTLQDENDSLRETVGRLNQRVSALDAQLTAATSTSAGLTAQLDTTSLTAAQVDGLREQLRQTNDQLNLAMRENEQLRTRLAIATPSPSSTYAAPTRPGSPTATAIARTPPAPARPSQSAAQVRRVHTVVAGDTLSGLALRYYGNPVRWAEIYDANRDKLPNERALRIGMELVIP